MTLRLLDQVRQDARAKVKRLDAAYQAIDALTDDEAELVYVKLEARIESKARTRTAPGKPAKSPTPPKRKIRSSNKMKATKPATAEPKFSDLAEHQLRSNPKGLRAVEIGAKIGQSVPNVFGTLKLLERQGRAQRHGSRYNTLWTLPGVTPVPRVATIAAAFVHVLGKSAEPMDARVLRDEVEQLVVNATGKKLRPESLSTELSKLVSKGIIEREGANEHGVMYVLAREKGAGDANILN